MEEHESFLSEVSGMTKWPPIAATETSHANYIKKKNMMRKLQRLQLTAQYLRCQDRHHFFQPAF